MREWTFGLTAEASGDRLRAGLPADVTFGEAREERLRRTWVDSFDWKLAEHDLSAFIVRTGPRRFRFTLIDGVSDELSSTVAALPGLARELPMGPLRHRVAAAIGSRRLLEQVTVSTRRSVSPVLDDEEKTIGWLAIEHRAASAPRAPRRHRLPPRIVCRSVRGFDDEVGAVCGVLSHEGLIAPDDQRELDLALAAIDRSVGDYSSKVRFALEPDMPATHALAAILQQLLDVMRANEPGLAARLDEEFLHDYRVAVRRTRSALGHFGDVLTPATLAWAKRFFADLGRRTGAARDLDVLLLELPDYARRLPEERQQGLGTVVARCEQDVAREYAAVSRWLESKSYRRALERWQRAIEKLAREASDRTIAELAARAIEETATRVFKQAKKVKRSVDNEPVHRLRIRCKKLRYVLEFSRSLTPGGEVADLVTALKRLQDVLGMFNDLVVHAPRLAETAQRPPADPELALAAGWLLAELDRRHRKTRKRVDGKMASFLRTGPPRLARALAHLRDEAA